jgi:hypothetical protein
VFVNPISEIIQNCQIYIRLLIITQFANPDFCSKNERDLSKVPTQKAEEDDIPQADILFKGICLSNKTKTVLG